MRASAVTNERSLADWPTAINQRATFSQRTQIQKHMNNTDENKRLAHIVAAILDLTREAIAPMIAEVENAAAEAAEDGDGEGKEKPVVAKLGISVKWPAGAEVPEVTVKAKYSVTRSAEHSGQADGVRAVLPLNGEGAE